MSLLNKKAPSFSLEDRKGETYKLSSFQRSYLVLFFYPKDNTPGCTTEATGFSSLATKFSRTDIDIVGISGGSNESKEKFCSKHSLKTLLLSDPDFAVSKKYGAYGPKKFMGREFEGILRSTFVLDSKRKVIKVFDKVKPKDHPQEVLDFIKEHKKTGA